MRKTTLKDLTGQTFGRLTVLERDLDPEIKRVRWICICECKNTKSVPSDNLLRGKTISCGCYNKEVVSQRSLTHGHSTDSAGNSRTYISWQKMKDRCCNPNNNRYQYYGGRGIAVCDEWRNDFSQFLSDMGERPDYTSLDRIDANSNYCAANCRWATTKQQANNKTNNVLVQLEEDAITLKEAAEQLGVSYKALHMRLQNGWELQVALSTPFEIQRPVISLPLEINGEVLTVKEWCSRYSISRSSFNYKYHTKGLSSKEIIESCMS